MNTVIPHLKQLLTSIDINLFPYQKGNSIYIGKSCVKKYPKSFKIFTNKKFVAETFTKLAALTIAKSKANTHLQNKICELDSKIEKHYNDCIFYKNALEKTKDKFKEDVLSTRLDISTAKIDCAVEELVNIFKVN